MPPPARRSRRWLRGLVLLVMPERLSIPGRRGGPRAGPLGAVRRVDVRVVLVGQRSRPRASRTCFVYIACLLLHGDRRDHRALPAAPAPTRCCRQAFGWRPVGLGLYAVGLAIGGHGHPRDRLAAAVRPARACCSSPGSSRRRGSAAVWANWMVGAAAPADPALALALGARRPAGDDRAGPLRPAARFRQLAWSRSGRSSLALSVAIATVFLYAPLHHRFFHGDTTQVGGVHDQRHRPRRPVVGQLGLLQEEAV